MHYCEVENRGELPREENARWKKPLVLTHLSALCKTAEVSILHKTLRTKWAPLGVVLVVVPVICLVFC